MSKVKFHSGYVSLTGRPNVGKSTLLNAILGEKIAIVTPKAQTTRNRIIGIKTLPNAQIIFIDTPGIHKPRHILGKIMVREAWESIKGVDLILLMVKPKEPESEDRLIIENIKGFNKIVFLVINKIDTIKKPKLLPVIDSYSKLYAFKEIYPISALRGDGIEDLLKGIINNLPIGPKYYPDDILTDQMERFMISEIIREKIIEKTGDEIPHSVAVEITDWNEKENGIIFIRSNIYVEREGQKGIIIGKEGLRLKEIGTRARSEIESLLGTKVFLELWVKVKRDWRSNERILRDLGFK